ncbi:unnamed protein product [Polarella glacialis]|uniref:Uncharacterized protein n=1 Tax=Polarella glacialis TaxID=89957 RepID=A0A813KBV7_POLGL|nr:unnamed protein product [Polarella glacialis]
MACLERLSVLANRLCGGEQVQGASVAATRVDAEDAVATFQGRPLPYAGMSTLSEEDLEVVRLRHLYRKDVPGDSQGLAQQIVGGGRRCRHGWPQAIVYDPLYRERPGKHFRLGDTTRLTCPLLVGAIDKMEKKGAMEAYNERLLRDPEWHGNFAEINEAHRLLRLSLVADRPEEMRSVRELYGETTFGVAMGAGLASMRPDAKADVKCLHAQVGDELIRGGNNLIAQQTPRDIEEQGISVDGTDDCCDNCNLQVPLEDARWRLGKCKNTAGKRLSRQRKGDQVQKTRNGGQQPGE